MQLKLWSGIVSSVKTAFMQLKSVGASSALTM